MLGATPAENQMVVGSNPALAKWFTTIWGIFWVQQTIHGYEIIGYVMAQNAKIVSGGPRVFQGFP